MVTFGLLPPQGEEMPWWKLGRVRLSLLGYSLVAFIYNLSDEVNSHLCLPETVRGCPPAHKVKWGGNICNDALSMEFVAALAIADPRPDVLCILLHFQVAPIYASSPPEDGGLGFTTSQLGIPLSISGISLLLYAAGGYKRMQRMLGVQRLARAGLLLAAPVWLGIPAASLCMPSTRGALVVMSISLVFKAVAGASTFTSSMVMVNVAAPPKQLGQVNGMGQSLAAFVRGAGPAIGGWLWSVSLATGLPYHQFLIFAGLSLASICMTYIYLPRVLHIPGLS